MANPAKYTPTYNFSNWQTLNPTMPLPAPRVDEQFDDISQAMGQTNDALADIRRSDGKLKNGIVTPESLSASLSIGFTLRGPWQVGVVYGEADGVTYKGKFYRAYAGHLSTLATAPDISPQTWQYLASASDVVDLMTASVYDPGGRAVNVYDRANHVGTQAISTVNGLQPALDAIDATLARRKKTVFLDTGQSNSANRLPYVWPLPIPSNLWRWNFNGEVQPATAVGTAFERPDGTEISVGLATCLWYAMIHPDEDVYHVHVARGGLPISNWGPTPTVYGFRRAIENNVNAALNKIGAYNVDFMLWWQGESDGGNVNYQSDFAAFHAWLRGMAWFNWVTPMCIFGLSSLAGPSFAEMTGNLTALCADEPETRLFVNPAKLPAYFWEGSGNLPYIHMNAVGYWIAGRMAQEALDFGVGQGFSPGVNVNPSVQGIAIGRTLSGSIPINTAFERFVFQYDQNLSTGFGIKNLSPGANAQAALVAQSDAGLAIIAANSKAGGGASLLWAGTGALRVSSATGLDVRGSGNAPLITKDNGLVTRTSVPGQLGNAAADINRIEKYEGKIVFDNAGMKLYVATGPYPVSQWVVADGSAFITPA